MNMDEEEIHNHHEVLNLFKKISNSSKQMRRLSRMNDDYNLFMCYNSIIMYYNLN
jgi:hypothetical protein